MAQMALGGKIERGELHRREFARGGVGRLDDVSEIEQERLGFEEDLGLRRGGGWDRGVGDDGGRVGVACVIEGGCALDEERHGAADALHTADEPWEEGFGGELGRAGEEVGNSGDALIVHEFGLEDLGGVSGLGL
jgi:hypothetical protein